MRPVFCVVALKPVLPTPVPTASTAGSARMTSATRLCSASMAGKEMSSTASVVTEIWPMSSSGKKPLGMVMNSTTVSTSCRSPRSR